MADLGPRGITLLEADVTDGASVAELKKNVERITDGKLHYLVNNAGMHFHAPNSVMTPD